MNIKLILFFSFFLKISFGFTQINDSLTNNLFKYFNNEFTLNSISDSSHLIVLFVNNKNCKPCVNKVKNTISDIKNADTNVKIVIITPIYDTSDFSNKIRTYLLIKDYKFADTIVFELFKKDGLSEVPVSDNSFFKLLSIDITPAIVKLSNKNSTFFSYHSLFDYNLNYNTNWYITD